MKPGAIHRPQMPDDLPILEMVPSRVVRRSPEGADGAGDGMTARTSYVERQNLTMRMNIRRNARRTNAFSKKLVNHVHAVALHFMVHNFCIPHQTLMGQTPAQAAGITHRQWEMEDILHLVDSN